MSKCTKPDAVAEVPKSAEVKPAGCCPEDCCPDGCPDGCCPDGCPDGCCPDGCCPDGCPDGRSDNPHPPEEAPCAPECVLQQLPAGRVTSILVLQPAPTNTASPWSFTAVFNFLKQLVLDEDMFAEFAGLVSRIMFLAVVVACAFVLLKLIARRF